MTALAFSFVAVDFCFWCCKYTIFRWKHQEKEWEKFLQVTFSATYRANRPVRDQDLLLLGLELWVFLIFRLGGNVLFRVFRPSSVDEMRILLFSAHHPWMKRRICCFSFVIRGWNADFTVFCSSSVAETQDLLFFVRHPWMKRRFCCFLLFVGVRNAVFTVFCSS